MTAKFITVKDVEGTWHSINIKQIKEVSWGEYPDDQPVDIIHLSDSHEIALAHKSEWSYELAGNFDNLDLDEIIDIESDEENDDCDSDDDDND